MSNDPEFEKRLNNKIETILETQANLQEAIAGLIKVARIHDEHIDQNSRQIKENSEQIIKLKESIDELAQQGKEQNERINVLIRIVEDRVSNHS
jgi:uncharacterized coiled-coil DUF342 family protein